MTDQKEPPRESLSSFVEKAGPKCSEYDKILGRNVLVAPSEEQYELLLKRLKQQLGEGRGEVILEIGASEDGSENGLLEDELEAAVATLQSLANTLECSCVRLRERKETRGVIVQYLIRRVLDQSDFLEIRVAVVGNVDAGKSTLLGVLTHGDLDNGRGTARQKLFRHKHEMESGRTSSVGNDILGFDGEDVSKKDSNNVPREEFSDQLSHVSDHSIIQQTPIILVPVKKLTESIQTDQFSNVTDIVQASTRQSTLTISDILQPITESAHENNFDKFFNESDNSPATKSTQKIPIATSNVIQPIAECNVVNKPEHGSLDWVKICEKSSKVITFIDLAGHERYLKTTVFGMTGHAPDFGMLMVGANAGIIGMTKEHLGLALALSVPVFVVVTKIDMCPVNVLQDNLKMLVRILKSPGCRKVPVMVKTADDVVLSATNFVSERLCPIFQVSNVTGENLGLLKTFLNLLTTRMEYHENEPAEFQIDDTYSVPGVGTVVSGTTLKGVIKLNDTLMLGPDPLGHFVPIAVKSIHRKRMAVKEVRAGQTASFALKKIKRSQIRKGMVMVAPVLNPQACWEFEGEILVLHHPTTISSRYQAMVHCGSIRQTASIMSMSKECLRTGDKAVIHFRFIKHPEYMTPGQRMVFREGRTKAVGNVVRIITQASPTHQGNRAKQNKQQRYGQGQAKNNKDAVLMKKDKDENVEKMVDVEEKENYLQEVSELATSNSENTFEGSSDKRDTQPQGHGTKKGRSRRGGRGKTSNKNPVETNNLGSVPVANRSTARVP